MLGKLNDKYNIIFLTNAVFNAAVFSPLLCYSFFYFTK